MASTVTVSTVFTDLVDSTAVSSRLGPAAAEDLRREHYTLLRAAIADAGGTEVKSTGDGLMVVFPSASAVSHYLGLLAASLGRYDAAAAHLADRGRSTSASTPRTGLPRPGSPRRRCSPLAPTPTRRRRGRPPSPCSPPHSAAASAPWSAGPRRSPGPRPDRCQVIK